MTMTFTATFGLVPGYGHTTAFPHSPDGLVADVVTEAIERVYRLSGVVVGCIVSHARCFYPQEFGCPVAGEYVVRVTGDHNPEFCGVDSWREAATAVVDLIQIALKQQRVTLTFSPTEVMYLKSDPQQQAD